MACAAGMAPINHYLLLGVERDATPEEIERGYKRVSTQTYVMLGGGGAGWKRTPAIEEAYVTLRDPVKRVAYDKLLDEEPGDR